MSLKVPLDEAKKKDQTETHSQISYLFLDMLQLHERSNLCYYNLS